MDGLMEFTDGQVVGKVSEFKTEIEFTKAVQEEFGVTKSESQVKRRHCRFYTNPPFSFPDRHDFPDGAYVTCQPGRGAFEIFLIDR